ncbi:MAG TPA: GAF domain-containing protein [Burkholderiales bacterium]|jgi:signal transduction histidine kinase/DNA-binding NarL/FixJ family response regulator|nr:GAF domain-containing protein [Burkholderiales bacterium]
MEPDSRDQELGEALEQQRVTSEILRAIANSSTDPGPIFETIVTSATRLCEANFAFVMLNEGGRLVLAARTDCTPEFAAFLQGGKPPNRATTTGRAALERRPVQVLDFLAEPGTLVTEAHRAENVRTVLAVPMCGGDRLLGVMSVWRREVRAFSERQIQLLETFANQAVIALENVRLFQETQGRNRELAEALEQQTATSEVLKLISRSTFDLEPVLRSLVEYATKLCAAEQGFIFRRDEDGYRMAVAYHVPADFREWRQVDAIQPGDGTMVGRVALEGRTIQIVDTQNDADWLAAHRDAPGIDGVRTLLGVPMLRENVPIGVIALWRTAVQPFTDKQIELITTFADQAVIAIENVRLFRELETRNKDIAEALEKQTATAEILRAISASPTDPQPVFEAIVRNAVALCGSLFANVFRYDGELLHYAASHNTGPGYVELLREKYPMRPDMSQVSGRVLLSKLVVRLEDARSDPNYDQRFPTAMGWRRMLGVPMLRDGKPLGAIVVGWADAGPIPKAQEELLCTFADQAVIAIENVRLFRELEARNEEVTEALQQQTATSEVLRVISSSPTDVQPVFEMIAKNAVTLCDGQFSGVFTFDGELVRLLAFQNLTTQGAEVYRQAFPRPAARDSAIGRAIVDRAIVQIPDVLEDPEYELRDLARAGTMRCIIAVPMLRDGNPIGGIVVWRSRPELFTQHQVQLVATFADQAVIAIENVRLFGEIQEKSRQLELANTYKSRFLAAASHDLRQPLHALNLFVAQLHGEPDPAERRRLVGRIDAAISSMNELFNALLDMSKLDAGVLEVNVTDFPVERLLKQMETTFAEAAREKGLQLKVSSSRAWVHSDFILLERILLNLVSNAVRYTANGGIVIGCHRHGDRLRLDVEDSGTGIPEDQQRNIFREFYQLPGPEEGRRGGLGLGLAIVDRLCRLLDHPVEVASTPGKGSRFSVSVPLVVEQPGLTEPATSTAPIADPLAGKLIVVIDDDALVLDAMRGMLRRWGCSVVTEQSETAALERLTGLQRKPDLIISDYRLAKGRTGIEAIERLRGALGETIPAFLMSGDTAPGRLRDASAGGYHLLHKPVPPMTLRAMLNRLLKPRSDGAPLHAAIREANRRPSRGGARDRARQPR